MPFLDTFMKSNRLLFVIRVFLLDLIFIASSSNVEHLLNESLPSQTSVRCSNH